jgi:fermentation-respiration switch protein FrsA (DUF1100 family)
MKVMKKAKAVSPAKKAAKAALGVAAVAAAVADVACDYAIKRPNPNKKKPETRDMYIKRNELRKINNRKFFELNPEDVAIKGITGLTMKGWFLPAEKETKRFVICVHGYHSNGPDEFSHMMPFYHYEMGYNMLLPDLTGHGRSSGKYVGFGSFDSKNILLWVDYLINRFGEDIEIILHGISMGAATVMNCNEMSPQDQVKLVIEDCGYTSTTAEMNNTLKDLWGFEVKPLVSLASVCSKVKAGYFFGESDPLKNMNKAKNPMLFIHGEADTFVPFEYGKQLYDACPVEKDYLWVPDAVHAFSYYDAKDEYNKKVKDFIAKHLDAKEEAVVK